MTRETLIKKTIDSLTRLPDQKIKEVSDFAEALLTRVDDQLITHGIERLVAESKSFSFVEEEEELYTKSDLKENYK